MAKVPEIRRQLGSVEENLHQAGDREEDDLDDWDVEEPGPEGLAGDGDLDDDEEYDEQD